MLFMLIVIGDHCGTWLDLCCVSCVQNRHELEERRLLSCYNLDLDRYTILLWLPHNVG
jgi:hypothetical protein